ncbi:SAM-dependent methyltransferase [Catenuloplanes japonicus]|uniref:SAM-dependent methyltransferase n=1 Tax=Catenuloplanes japonicus TaxID=33876 RepID=UPI000527ABFA|nr:SAM-dependent methyltransferase [Catenuloplanes japonicus]
MTAQSTMPLPDDGALFPRAAFVSALLLGQDVGTAVERAAAAARSTAVQMDTGLTTRSHADIVRILHGTTLLETGTVSVPQWRPDVTETVAGLADTDVHMWAAVTRCG